MLCFYLGSTSIKHFPQNTVFEQQAPRTSRLVLEGERTSGACVRAGFPALLALWAERRQVLLTAVELLATGNP